MKTNDNQKFYHPCKQTCSGYKQGFWDGQEEIKKWVIKEIECCHNLSLELPNHAASRYEAVILAFQSLLSWIKSEDKKEDK